MHNLGPEIGAALEKVPKEALEVGKDIGKDKKRSRQLVSAFYSRKQSDTSVHLASTHNL